VDRDRIHDSRNGPNGAKELPEGMRQDDEAHTERNIAEHQDMKNSEEIYDLVDVIEGRSEEDLGRVIPDEEIRKQIIETAEKIAREMFPSIAERIIREEIEKLKSTV